MASKIERLLRLRTHRQFDRQTSLMVHRHQGFGIVTIALIPRKFGVARPGKRK
jgi:hypothetical protein